MKKLSQKVILMAAIGAALSGCNQNVAKESLDVDIQAQIVSTNPCSSATACSNAFVNALSKFSTDGKSDFCDELVVRKDSDLAVCEVQIRSSKFADLISSCKSDLTAKLDNIVAARNAGLKVYANVNSTEPLGLGFKLESEVQERDTSKGYYTVSGDVKPKQVILTFDDGPEPTNTRSILRTLEEAGAKALFFELGLRVQESPETTKLVAAQGHAIGNHSWDHPNMRVMPFEQAAAQIKKTQSILLKVLGWVDPFFRFPFGNRTPQLDQMLAENQMADFYWTIDSNDWRMVNADGTVRTNAQVVKDTITQLDRKGRGIILMHDIHRRTAELLPELLRLISERGYTTVLLQPAQAELKKSPPILVNKTVRLGSAAQ